jgi:hypothetical protein
MAELCSVGGSRLIQEQITRAGFPDQQRGAWEASKLGAGLRAAGNQLCVYLWILVCLLVSFVVVWTTVG